MTIIDYSTKYQTRGPINHVQYSLLKLSISALVYSISDAILVCDTHFCGRYAVVAPPSRYRSKCVPYLESFSDLFVLFHGKFV